MTKGFAGLAHLALLLLIALPGAGTPQPQEPPAGGQPAATPFEFNVSLNLVVLPTTVRDKKGGFVTDLTQQDFQVYEDNTLQSIRLFRHEDVPVTVGLVVDHSGSMQRKIADVLTAARAFVRFSNPEDQMFVVNFNERVTLGLPPSVPFTDDADELDAAIQKAPATGETALYDALDVALDRLRKGDREKKALIVISDGGDNASVIDLNQILKKATRSDALIYTIGIFDQNDSDQNPGVLRKLARVTGGEAFFPAQFSQVTGICQDIAGEIRHQYTIGYVSTSASPSGYRKLRVVARRQGRELMVRTRAGYVAGQAPAPSADSRKPDETPAAKPALNSPPAPAEPVQNPPVAPVPNPSAAPDSANGGK